MLFGGEERRACSLEVRSGGCGFGGEERRACSLEVRSGGCGFGDDVPPDHPLHAFQDFYLQAEISLPALVQIRREWDRFLVPEEHPDGSAVPQAWVLPEPPADEAWASALVKHISL
ncbi:hypothetical protein AALO_G00269140 [Alosa alosa]|uniref:Uncharacterized protein n=1 Tax=Alosa alosa TaxID=278164 RepID=A0AAV6FMA5_9TELE|nr:hypothetical protein AALO_G00269140 [Alosa alosa]